MGRTTRRVVPGGYVSPLRGFSRPLQPKMVVSAPLGAPHASAAIEPPGHNSCNEVGSVKFEVGSGKDHPERCSGRVCFAPSGLFPPATAQNGGFGTPGSADVPVGLACPARMCRAGSPRSPCYSPARPAIRPKTMQSVMAHDPRRQAPWTPPVISPAAKKPGMGRPQRSRTRARTSIPTPPMV